jgi:hypothetical protein
MTVLNLVISHALHSKKYFGLHLSVTSFVPTGPHKAFLSGQRAVLACDYLT